MVVFLNSSNEIDNYPDVDRRLRYRYIYGSDEFKSTLLRFMIKANIAKFEQNKDLMDILLSTGSKLIMHISGDTEMYGMMCVNREELNEPFNWFKYPNYLGKALMYIRGMNVKPTIYKNCISSNK